jgi:hypothetical protein
MLARPTVLTTAATTTPAAIEFARIASTDQVRAEKRCLTMPPKPRLANMR